MIGHGTRISGISALHKRRLSFRDDTVFDGDAVIDVIERVGDGHSVRFEMQRILNGLGKSILSTSERSHLSQSVKTYCFPV